MVKKFLTALIIGLTLSSAVFAEDVEISSDAKLIYNEGVNLYKLGEYDRAM